MLKVKISKNFFYSPYQGFSLLELMVVVAIIGILSSIAIYSYSGYTDKARVSNAMSILENLKSEAVKNYLENGTFPNIPATSGTGTTTPPYTDSTISNSKIVGASSYSTLNTNVIGYVQITFSSTTTTELRGKVLALVAIETENALKWQCVNGNETGANTININLLPKVCQS